MGVGTILDARQVVLMGFGEHKALVIALAVEGDVTPSVAASFLQEHSNAQFVLDEAAAAELTRRKAPWLLGAVDWDDLMIRRAVIWLAQRVKKAILKLRSEDYNEEGLQDLLAEHGPADKINVAVFRKLQATISGWPGGKPERDKQPGDRSRPFDNIYPKRILIFSPHPDDDVISMGGTLIRLVEHGHDVHVAYQTSGNIAVFDDDAIRFADFVAQYNRQNNIDVERTQELDDHVDESLKHKKAGQIDTAHVQNIKALIRRGEAIAATRSCGLAEEKLHFLDMPFYETGRVRKKPLSDEDVQIVVDLLHDLQPHQIYAAGDLSDPHGTHRTCLAAVVRACEKVMHEDWYANCEVWLYRGAWHEWGPHEIEMAVPLSPREVDHKRYAIFKHESQKNRALSGTRYAGVLAACRRPQPRYGRTV